MSEQAGLSDTEFMAQLKDASLAPEQFNHRGHLRAGFLLLRETQDFAKALGEIERLIRAFAQRYLGTEGAAQKYHATITTAYMALIHERMLARPKLAEWEAFAATHEELFSPGLLQEVYPPEQLESTAARRIFVLPQVRNMSVREAV